MGVLRDILIPFFVSIQILEEEVNKMQLDVSNIADQGRLLAHKIDLDDHDKAIRIYRQVEDMKVCTEVLIQGLCICRLIDFLHFTQGYYTTQDRWDQRQTFLAL